MAGERRSELDALRALVVVGLVFFHSALVFDSRDDYYVKNAQTTDATMIVGGLGVVWAMPMLFLAAGLGARYSLRARGVAGFVRERLLRLGVPLLFAELTILPLPQWLRERAAEPDHHESYVAFLPRFYDVRLDPGAFPFVVQGEHFETGHLWFVVLLLAFSLLLAPPAHWLPRERMRALGERVAAAVERHRGASLLPALAFAALCALVGLEEEYGGWHRWAYLLFFCSGFVLACDDRYRAAMRRDAVRGLVFGLVLFVACLPGFMAADDPFTDMTPLAALSRTGYGAAGWCWLVAILGLLDRRAQRRAREKEQAEGGTAEEGNTGRAPVAGGAANSAAAEGGSAVGGPAAHGRARRLYAVLGPAVLPLYVLHQPIVVAVAYGVVGLRAPMPVKYAVIVAASLTLTVLAYDLLVRRTRLTRFLFGMRPVPRAEPEPPGPQRSMKARLPSS
ncbi:acyltransferase family protein [Streptomyces iconiensis]|uniref:Acyltransferase n=1 Tax=Streptomyces iconiensis TaxID=1384038 RepID=A0ABT6ZT75_9ACTN|nr:acyltransferase [Streptomyces iconiensis]MDJ1132272.1 acyltransferase [Streptomyces iconiensis]